MHRWFVFLAVMGCESAEDQFLWDVTVTGVETDCTAATEGYQESFTYELITDGSEIEIRIDGEAFGAGVRSGCSLSYESSVWLEEGGGGDLRWQVTGEAAYESSGGGCDLPEGIDWQGEEVITVLASEDPDVPEGCEYLMDVEGVYVGD